MADPTKLIGTSLQPTHRHRTSFTQAEAVSKRAEVTDFKQTPKNHQAIQRLDQTLESGQDLRDDVPRGHYIDILV